MSDRPARPRAGSRAAFPVDLDPDNANVAALGGRLHLSFPDGRSYRADLSPLGHRRLMAAVATALTVHVASGAGVTAPASAAGYIEAVRRFAAHLDDRHPDADLGPGDLGPDDLDSFEEALRARYSTGSTTPYVSVNKVVFLLRLVTETCPVRAELTARLRWGASGPTGTTSPRDAYSGAVAASLRRAARTAMSETIFRLTVTGPQLVAQGRSPGQGSWRNREDVVWEIDRVGVLSQAALFAGCERQGVPHQKWNLGELHRLLYPANDDLAAFFLAFALESGMEVECIRGLRADCLVNAARGYVEVVYTKNRRRGSPEGRLRIRDGNLTTPGGILRAAITVTARARRAMGTDYLWVCYGQGRLHRTTLTPWSNAESCPIKAFVERHDLRDDDGGPLHLLAPRLRKTHKAERYRATAGRLDVFVTGHSAEVAAKHYADIPALRETHEQAVADALTEAVAAATGTGPAAGPQNEPLGPLAGHLATGAATGADTDVWMASCADFHASPFAPTGQPCSAPPWACLECTNATFDVGRLPALITFASWCEDQRAELPAEVWAARLGRAHTRVTRQILPAFPEKTIAEAAAVAGADPLAVWLPLVAGSGS